MRTNTIQEMIRAAAAGAKQAELSALIEDSNLTHLETMTNWQRHQFARAGYPPHRRGEFARLQRPADR